MPMSICKLCPWLSTLPRVRPNVFPFVKVPGEGQENYLPTFPSKITQSSARELKKARPNHKGIEAVKLRGPFVRLPFQRRHQGHYDQVGTLSIP